MGLADAYSLSGYCSVGDQSYWGGFQKILVHIHLGMTGVEGIPKFG